MKEYVHEKRNMLQSALWHAGNIKRNPELFSLIYNENNELVDPSTITRKNELVGAGIQYTMSIVDYFCTHHFDEIRFTEGSAKRGILPPLTWKMAINIATGGIAGQRKRAEAAILNLRAAQKPIHFYDYDYDTNGISYSMIPFIIDLSMEDGKKMETAAAAKLARLIKGKPEQPYQVIKNIDIQFAKPLYEGFFRKRSKTFSFPNGMYAQFFQMGNEMKKQEKKIRKELQESGIKRETGFLENADSEPNIAFYCRLARYIALHHNLTPKDKYKYIYKTLGEIMADVQPTMVNWVNGIPHPKDIEEARILLTNGIVSMLNLDGFEVYPILEDVRPDGKFIIGLWRDRNEAIQHRLAKRQNEKKQELIPLKRK